MTRTATTEPRIRRSSHPWRVTALEPAWRVRPRRKAWFVPTPPSGTAQLEPCASPTKAAPEKIIGAFARALAGAQNMTVDDHSSSASEDNRNDSHATPGTGHGQEHGDRDRFLAEARRRLAVGVAPNKVHPLPADSVADAAHPPPPTFGTVSSDADGEELIAAFARTVTEAGAVCHVVEDHIPELILDDLVSEFEAWQVVVSAEPEAQALADQLAMRGAEVHSATPAHAAQAAMGVTSASAGIAATGSIVLDSSRTGSRVVSALPLVHVCVLPADRIVASPSEVLRPLGDATVGPPASLVVVTGPSRSGDIEQILTVGAHGPAQLHVIVVKGGGKPSPDLRPSSGR